MTTPMTSLDRTMLVTGSAGYLCSHTVHALRETGHDVDRSTRLVTIHTDHAADVWLAEPAIKNPGLLNAARRTWAGGSERICRLLPFTRHA